MENAMKKKKSRLELKRGRSQMSSIHRARLERDRRKGRRLIFGVSAIVLAVVCILTVQISHLNSKNEDYKEQEEQLSQELKEEKQRTAELKNEQKYVKSKKYIEDQARSKLGMAYKNEIIFKEK